MYEQMPPSIAVSDRHFNTQEYRPNNVRSNLILNKIIKKFLLKNMSS